MKHCLEKQVLNSMWPNQLKCAVPSIGRQVSLWSTKTKVSPNCFLTMANPIYLFPHVWQAWALLKSHTEKVVYVIIGPNSSPSLLPCPFSCDFGIPPIKVKYISLPIDCALSHVTC